MRGKLEADFQDFPCTLAFYIRTPLACRCGHTWIKTEAATMEKWISTPAIPCYADEKFMPVDYVHTSRVVFPEDAHLDFPPHSDSERECPRV
jgi:hypothetical protein